MQTAPTCLPGASAATAAAPATAAGEAAAAAARSRRGRRERRAESRGEVADRDAELAPAEVAVGARSSRSTTLAPAPRASPDALPGARGRRSRTRSRRRGTAPRARASRAAPPAAGGSRSGSAGRPPSARPRPRPPGSSAARAALGQRPTTIRGVDQRGDAERGAHDVAPAWVDRTPARATRDDDAARPASRRTRAARRTSGTPPARRRTSARPSTSLDTGLERGEVLAHRLALRPIVSRKFDSRAVPPPRTRVDDVRDDPPTASASPAFAREISRSATLLRRRPPQIECSVVTGFAL